MKTSLVFLILMTCLGKHHLSQSMIWSADWLKVLGYIKKGKLSNKGDSGNWRPRCPYIVHYSTTVLPQHVPIQFTLYSLQFTKPTGPLSRRALCAITVYTLVNTVVTFCFSDSRLLAYQSLSKVGLTSMLLRRYVTVVHSFC